MIDKELRERSLNAPARGDAAPREKILKLGKKITDVIDHKLGKITSDDPEYWGLAGVVTDEMADIALSMKLRTPYTVAELWKMNKVTDEQKPHFQELLDQMSSSGFWNTTMATTTTITAAPRRSRSGATSCRCSFPAARSCSTWRRTRSFPAGIPVWRRIRSWPSSSSA